MDESDETYDPILPEDLDVPKKPSYVPPPLPRMWKSPPEADEVDESPPAKPSASKKIDTPAPKTKVARPKVSPKKSKVEPVIDDGTGAIKLEETPVLDTVEARQRARWLVGVLGAVIVTVFGFIIAGAFKGNGGEEIREGEPPDLRKFADSSSGNSSEVEARNLFENAKQADKLGRLQAAVNLLNKVVKTYPSTAAAREALIALDRNRVDKPLFGDDLPRQADGPTKPPGSDRTVAGGAPPPVSNPNPPPPSATATRPEPPKTANAPVAPQPPANPVVTPVVQIKPLPSGYRPNFDAPIHPSGWPTRIHSDRDGVEMVLIPAGAFDMGRGDGDPQEGPVHPVSLTAYYIDKHEVTVRQYLRFLKDSGRPLDAVKKGMPKGVDPAAFENYPIVGISWNEAKAYCDWAHRFLPTEAQWEMAARSTEGRISYWNGELPRKDPEKGPRVMQPVMSLPSDYSAYGVFDMGANAWEWTADVYESQYYQQFRNLAIDPPGPSKKGRSGLLQMAVRGGSKYGFLTWREGIKVETRAPYLGFRGAFPVEPPVNSAPANTPPAVAPGRGGFQGPF
jgi:formylglycine-generating enzyme required for sulfatase activity